MKILNLYCGIGGNRKLWGDDHKITAIEYKQEIAVIYQDFFPNDKVIVVDAHQYLLKHFNEFDFIWSSPPCPSPSRVRKCTSFDRKTGEIKQKPIYPDMKLYEEILFLQGYFKGKWCVENVKSWYKPLIPPYEIASHYFWSNFFINDYKADSRKHDGTLDELAIRKGFELWQLKGDKRTILRNCVEPEVGLHIFKEAFREQKTLV